MTENVGDLQALEARMLQLIHARDRTIEAAELMIDQANCEFDAVAVELGRAINETRASSKPAAVKRQRKVRAKKEPAMDGLTDAEKAMFRQMLTRKAIK